jgi:3'-phosphoadenosine 5'-phosphosulfate sulfotransferase (PAPS reductase)/FAD synthetase
MKLSEIKRISAINRCTNGKTLHVVQISGGKDSQAVAKLVRERYPNEHIIGLFADTMFEHPITYNHPDKITNLYNLEKVVVCFEFIKGEHNPLYDDGFESVGCFPCMAGGDKWKQKAFAYDAVGAQHYKMMKRLEPMVIANKHYPIFTSAKGKKAECENSQNGCSFCSI